MLGERVDIEKGKGKSYAGRGRKPKSRKCNYHRPTLARRQGELQTIVREGGWSGKGGRVQGGGKKIQEGHYEIVATLLFKRKRGHR